ncbi:hypothetical protein [Spiroplasma platyhelix]|uniref:Uncharacterized protein n=1 Tax=Spiroplasma platyhelix PALS-1 TaxID=1276218 RepID=A0A846TVK6_9MOLU|nr:hypothetical protein [Spiroplasma platyhelix]MBE4703809.1 hypothetical protein [Spiroplasma platyhelix PALS-1]NKE38182.1 hypothetical protein [Spiroplasma platyhelix PALS-1]UJB29067.1 hypothetical protein SPLAT_v1c03030 [Spiroplasma platyhelix PALS-1]
MKKLLATMGVLAIATPASVSLTNLNSTTLVSTQATIEEQIVEAVKANIGRIPEEALTIYEILTVNQFIEEIASTIPFLMALVLPSELLDQFDLSLVQTNNITLDGKEITDEILQTEGKKVTEINFNYGSVKNETISLNLTFNFN